MFNNSWSGIPEDEDPKKQPESSGGRPEDPKEGEERAENGRSSDANGAFPFDLSALFGTLGGAGNQRDQEDGNRGSGGSGNGNGRGFGGFGMGGPRGPRGPQGPGFSFGSMKPILKHPGTIVLLIVLLTGGFIYGVSGIWTDVLWYNQIGYASVFWTRILVMGGLFLLGTVLQALVLWLYLTFSYRALVNKGIALNPNMKSYREGLENSRKLIFIVLPIVFGATTGLSLMANWREVLLWWHSSPFPDVDPIFGYNISFFVFTLPVLQLVLQFLSQLLIVGLIAGTVIHYLYGGIQLFPKWRVLKITRIQLGLTAAVLALIYGARMWVRRYALLAQVNDTALGVDGGMYREISAQLPAQSILAITCVIVAAMFVLAAFRDTWKLPTAALAVLIVSQLVVGSAYPALIQQFKVVPNAQELESPYIQHNIDATLKAYGMDNVDYTTSDAVTTASAGQLRKDSESTAQIRLLDPNVVSPTFTQVQQNRLYYGFDDQLSVDRYNIDGQLRDTVIAVRELNQAGLAPEQRNWVNDHTVYTHGFGVVAAYGNTANADGRPDFSESSIPSVGFLGDYEPRVYFGRSMPEYSIVGGPKSDGKNGQELDYPDDKAEGGQVKTTYQGDGGPSVGNFWNKLLYSIKFRSTDLFFSDQVNPKSQILYTRTPEDRVAAVAPYLTLERKAYPAVVDMDGDPKTPKRLVWILDAYTTTDNYPYAQHTEIDRVTQDSTTGNTGLYSPRSRVNYIRNSVKAVVDAYDGKVTLYQWDQSDPILKAWMGVFPGKVKPTTEISGDLMAHLRYPEDLFKLQRHLLATYHVTDAKDYYTGGDRWRIPGDPTVDGGDATSQPPYYLTLKMPGQDKAQFSLSSVYVPGGSSKREAMAGYIAVDSETGDQPGKIREGFGKLRIMALPSSTTVPGPGQVQSNLSSKPQVSKELNLMNQRGSQVIRGNLLTLPVGGGLLYVQPVYVKSSQGTAFPLLRSVLVSFGEKVGFAPTLAEALDQVFGGDAGAATGDEAIAGKKPSLSEDAPPASEPSASVEAPGSVEAPAKPVTPPAAPAAPSGDLKQALENARQAMEESQQAMKAGDWARYGEAQKRLQQALEEAVKLQEANK
ncbi:hypothetical protein BSR28_08450 [Boudabousia liubingyangii]|uniref:UPF0182 family membrane protein n=1 Tax=Boudabousia liubingyangii TaxID=1921764 RepID=UPI000939E78F|nr:UPF0182 family protein [Boudabousia liubingyangii]OKL46081.1 hypothetical protein BSR28_08450 [Boudabousia liubingyangii]